LITKYTIRYTKLTKIKKEQLVQDLDGNHIVFRIDDGNMEVTQDVLEINVSLAHFDLTKKTNYKNKWSFLHNDTCVIV
jgi:hypothetical protein